jgi:hypothetical protein
MAAIFACGRIQAIRNIATAMQGQYRCKPGRESPKKKPASQ